MNSNNKPLDLLTATSKTIDLAFMNRQPMSGIKRIITHHSPHLDEIAAIFMLQNTDEGKKIFPGIENAQIGFISDTSLRESELLGKNGFIEAMKQGCLLVGIGKGYFDEHGDRGKYISCAERVKLYLDLFKNPQTRSEYGQLLKFINFEDNHGDNIIGNLNKINDEVAEKDPEKKRVLSKDESEALLLLNLGSIAQSLKKGFEAAETIEEQEQVLRMGLQFLKNEIKQRKLFITAGDEYNKAEKDLFDLPNNHYALVVKSNNPLIAKVAHQRGKNVGGRNLGILIVYRDNGQFVIMPQNGFAESMKEVAKILRQKIRYSRSEKGLPFERLESFGTLSEVPEIYFDENMFIIMNGSKTDPDVEGLIGKHLNIETIVDAVKTVLFKRFDARHAKSCSSGTCVKQCSDKPCSLFSFNLNHCVEVRRSNNVTAQALKKAGVTT